MELNIIIGSRCNYEIAEEILIRRNREKDRPKTKRVEVVRGEKYDVADLRKCSGKNTTVICAE